jgi:hypothetical protein
LGAARARGDRFTPAPVGPWREHHWHDAYDHPQGRATVVLNRGDRQNGGRLEGSILPYEVVTLFKQALGNLARLIGGTEYSMTSVSRV